MTKSKRAKEEKKKDFVKKKIKVGKTLKKPQNETITTFKSRAIVINKQLQEKAKTDFVSSKRYSLEELLTKFDHPSVNRKLDACNGMKELIEKLPLDQIESKLSAIMSKISRCLINSDPKLRSSAVKLIDSIIDKVGSHTLSYHFKLLATHISCSLVSLHSDVKADSIKLLHILIEKTPDLLRLLALNIIPSLLRILGARAKSGIDLRKEFSSNDAPVLSKKDMKKSKADNKKSVQNKGGGGIIMKQQQNSLLSQLDVAVVLTAILQKTVQEENIEIDDHKPLTPFGVLLQMITPRVTETEKFILMSDEEKLRNFCIALLPAMFNLFESFLPSDAKLHDGIEMNAHSAHALQCLLQLLFITADMTKQCVKSATSCSWYIAAVKPIITKLMHNHFPFHMEETSSNNKDKKKKSSSPYDKAPSCTSQDFNVRLCSAVVMYGMCKGQYLTLVLYLKDLLSDESKLGCYDMKSTCILILGLVDHFYPPNKKGSTKAQSQVNELLLACFDCYTNQHPLKKQRINLLQLLLDVTDADHRHVHALSSVKSWCQHLLHEATESSIVPPTLLQALLQLRLRGMIKGCPETQQKLAKNLSASGRELQPEDVHRVLALLYR